MLLGRVIGTVVPAVLVDELSATPLLWVQPLSKRQEPEGKPFVCADGTRMAGPGELVYLTQAREADRSGAAGARFHLGRLFRRRAV